MSHPKMKLVRRARKSIRERRMKACLKDLSSNLEKVEMRVFRQQKQKRQQQQRKGAGNHITVPPDVLRGVMNPELYHIECRLHQEACMPPPPPYEGYSQRERCDGARRRIGFVEFVTIAEMVRLGAMPGTPARVGI
ncbi:uncharacterized protein TEOVI_000715600 [Trypanosoma equiperdum]|uniref:Uncharacterized protein n=2 Tax=Trypanozoon TaxID=39700 RepID=Q382H1_TRYB2|nr:hypothetical protein, conserved [Trypanosoma brucei brucei TREU927]EAN80310.1 hypothetical protein, conserved [Trypanosoma brucei brucei TREU927]SCU66269.1 hypothetical protein, conserved [Trypanosoma equiperdum]